jgi:methanogenic corrinoid protein MtbC1
MHDLIGAILEGNVAVSVSLARQLREQGVSMEAIITEGVEAAMSTLDAKCTLEQFNLLEIMLVGRAVMEVMKCLYPPGTAMVFGKDTKGTVVVATLEGDVHDLGKNILKMVLVGHGYRVVDCGKDCPLEKLVNVTAQESPLAVGISGLITPIIPLVRKAKDLLRLRSLDHVKVIAGGAALKQSSAQKLNVDFVAQSAFDSVDYLEGLVGEGR